MNWNYQSFSKSLIEKKKKKVLPLQDDNTCACVFLINVIFVNNRIS